MIKKISYRKNVVMITFKGPEFLLVNLETWPKGFWKFPQGGVNTNETLKEAVKREFKEELGSESVEILAQSKIKRKYKWDKPKVIDGKEYVGQDQTFFIIKYFGRKNDLKIEGGEVEKYCWVRSSFLERKMRRKEYDFVDYWKTIKKILMEQKEHLKF